MLKNLSKSMKWISIILLLIVCVFIVYTYSNDKGRVLDKMTNAGSYQPPNQAAYIPPSAAAADEEMVSPSYNLSGASVGASAPPMIQSQPQQQNQPPVYDAQQVANPSDLLPKDQNSQWTNLNPINGSVPVPVDLLQAGYQIGLDTIGQTLKNPNYQLRSDPIIEKKDIGPWMQSTIEPDYGRIPLEIGYGGR